MICKLEIVLRGRKLHVWTVSQKEGDRSLRKGSTASCEGLLLLGDSQQGNKQPLWVYSDGTSGGFELLTYSESL